MALDTQWDIPVTEVELHSLIERNGTSPYLEAPYRTFPAAAYAASVVRSSMAVADARTVSVRDGGTLAGLSVVRQSDWDSELFGIRVGRIEELYAVGEGSARALVQATEGFAREHGFDVCSVRVAGTDLAAIHALEAVGYRYQETTLAPWLNLSGWAPADTPNVRPAGPHDVEAMAVLAREMFRVDRFHGDTRFDPAAADELYAKWVYTWFAERSPSRDAVVFEHEGRVAGFVLFEFIEFEEFVRGPVGVIRLAGIGPRFTGRGFGRELWSGAINAAASKAAHITATMIASNGRALNLYTSLGFKITSTGVTLHRWFTESTHG
jgi:ribosomal protein S18 acetylase RimI-like enzyme